MSAEVKQLAIYWLSDVGSYVAQNHLVISMPIAIARAVYMLAGTCKQAKGVDTELGHFQAINELARPF